MPERERFNMTLSPEQKRRWEEYADESPEVSSLSHLVRLAVQKEMAESDAPVGTSDEVADRLSQILEQNRQLRNRVEGVESRLGSIEREVKDDPEFQKLKNEVMKVLPVEEQLRKAITADHARQPFKHLEDQHGQIDFAYTGSVRHIANILDEDESRVRDALDKLQRDMSRVYTLKPHEEVAVYPERTEDPLSQTRFDPDDVRYYKEV